MDFLKNTILFLLMGLVSSKQNFSDEINNIDPDLNFDKEVKMMAAQFQPILLDIQKKCDQANDTDSDVNLEETFDYSLSCTNTKLNSILNEYLEVMKFNNFSMIIDELCTIWPDVYYCIDILILESRNCLDIKHQHELDKTIDGINQTHNYFCGNDQQHIKEFINKRGAECLHSVSNELMTCTKPLLEHRKPKKGEESAFFYEEDCSKFKTVRSCIQTNIAKCSPKSLGVIIDGSLAIVQKTVCNSASNLTWWSIYNVLLILCSLFYTKLF